MSKFILLFGVLFGLLFACDTSITEETSLYKVNEYTPPIGTLDVKQKVKMGFVYGYTDSLRKQAEFFDVPEKYTRKLKGGLDISMNTFTKDRYFFISGQSEFILHMDYAVNHNLINVYWPEKDTIHWLNGNDVGKKIDQDAIGLMELEYNRVIDSLVIMAKKELVPDEEIFWIPFN